MYSNGYNVYKNNSITHASKEQLLLMLVDGAVKFSKMAREAIKVKDINKAHQNLVKTQDIFTELMVSLDVEAGEWAENLFQLYKYIKDTLVSVNLKKDIEKLDGIIPLIEDVRNLWHDVNDSLKNV